MKNVSLWYGVAAALVALLPVMAAGAAGDLWTVNEISYTTDYGLKMHGWLHQPAGDNQPGAPLIVTLPMLGTTHSAYEPFLDSLARHLQGDTVASVPYVLALDLRGHGASTSVGEKTVSWKTMEAGDWTPVPEEVAGFVRHVLEQYPEAIDAEQITLIGASIGANAAIMAAQRLEGAQAVAMLSPGSNYRGLKPTEALGTFDGRLLIFAARQDSYSAKSSDKMAKFNERITLQVFKGEAHGTDIINNVEGAMSELIGWLGQ